MTNSAVRRSLTGGTAVSEGVMVEVCVSLPGGTGGEDGEFASVERSDLQCLHSKALSWISSAQ